MSYKRGLVSVEKALPIIGNIIIVSTVLSSLWGESHIGICGYVSRGQFAEWQMRKPVGYSQR